MRARSDFERLRFETLHAPTNHGLCVDLFENSCYWAEQDPQPQTEPALVQERREQLLGTLGALEAAIPDSRWAVEQRIRYLEDAGRPDSALAAARECRVPGWACGVLVGFALHELGRYALADSVYERALKGMSQKERCDWRDIQLLIDDDLQHDYAEFSCGDARRDAFEDRVMYYARTLYSLDGNDSRTEHYARKTMDMMLRDAPDVQGDTALRPNFVASPTVLDVYQQLGWPRGWTKSRFSVGVPALRIVGLGGAAGWMLFPDFPRPAYRYVPLESVLRDPTTSDSSDWAPQPLPQRGGSPGYRQSINGHVIHEVAAARPPPPIARYAPPYARSLTSLQHQKAIFRRGDSALVVMAYDARVAKQLAGGTLTAALVVTPNGSAPVGYGRVLRNAPETGALLAMAPWRPLLMSAEVYAPDKQAVARARYGISPPATTGARVTLSDLLFYKPYGRFPASVEDAAPHALTTERLMANEKLGVYWESYGTDPAGEKMKVSLTVVKEVIEAGLLRRLTKSLRLVREATPVVVSVEDLSARGKSVTPRALEVDISALAKGSYIVQLEVEVAGQYAVQAEHRIEVIGP